MSYSQALEQQVSAIDWSFSTRSVEWFRYIRQAPEEAVQLWSKIAGEHYLGDPLLTADTYYWSSAIVEALYIASIDLQSMTLVEDLIPSKHGYCWFEQPLAMGTKTGYVALVALSWATVLPTRSSIPTVALTPWIRSTTQPFTRYGGMPFPGAAWEIGEDLCFNHTNDFGDALAALFGTMILFMKQAILVQTKMMADRHVRRRLERENFTHEPLVRVVELRRKQTRSEHHGESEPAEWSHQWIVSGHWRQQWYPSLNAYQPRWIMPYVKGPEDKPLKPPRAKVFAVVR